MRKALIRSLTALLAVAMLGFASTAAHANASRTGTITCGYHAYSAKVKVSASAANTQNRVQWTTLTGAAIKQDKFGTTVVTLNSGRNSANYLAAAYPSFGLAPVAICS